MAQNKTYASDTKNKYIRSKSIVYNDTTMEDMLAYGAGVVVWKNPDSTQAFAEQDVTLSADEWDEDWDYCKIWYLNFVSEQSGYGRRIFSEEVPIFTSVVDGQNVRQYNTWFAIESTLNWSDNTQYIECRYCNVVNKTTIHFGPNWQTQLNSNPSRTVKTEGSIPIMIKCYKNTIPTALPGDHAKIQNIYDTSRYNVYSCNYVNTKADKSATGDNTDLVTSEKETLVGAINEVAFNQTGDKKGDTLPIGSICPYAGKYVPAGWLECDGQEVSRNTFADLFAVIGITFGEGNGDDTFNVPDLRVSVPVGRDKSDSDFAIMGTSGGEREHTLTVNEIPAHKHTMTSVYDDANYNHGTIPSNNGPFSIPYDGGSNKRTQNTDNTGGGQPHNNMQPYLVTKYIIKAFQSSGLLANVSNNRVVSETDTYSCNYINSLSITDAYDNIPVGTVVAYEGTNAPEGWEIIPNDNYTTFQLDEIRIGTWLKKPLYRKMIKGTMSTSVTSVTVSINIDNVETFVNVYAKDPVAKSYSSNKPISEYYYSSTDFFNCFMNTPANGSVNVRCGSSWPIRPFDFYVFVEYTKTTDEEEE